MLNVVKGDLKLQQRLIDQFIEGRPKITVDCLVCTKVDNKMWRKLAVDVRRIQVHCEVHAADFHEVVEWEHGCVTCQRYHPFERSFRRLDWQHKQDKLLNEELKNRSDKLKSAASVDEGRANLLEHIKGKEFTGYPARWNANSERVAREKAEEDVMTAQSKVDEIEGQLDEKTASVNETKKKMVELETNLIKAKKDLFNAKEELMKAEAREVGIFESSKGRQLFLGKRQRSPPK